MRRQMTKVATGKIKSLVQIIVSGDIAKVAVR